jgi:hypothetical protein
MRARSAGRRARVVLGVTAGAGAVVGSAAWLASRPFEEAARRPSPPNLPSIYDDGERSAATPVISPFHLHVDPMQALLLVNFEKDPDRIYLGFEPQTFDDDVHGRGLLVLGWRVDGRVDVFHEPELRLEPRTYGIAGKGLHRMAERSFGEGRLDLGPSGAQVALEFRDFEDRQVRLHVSETNTRPRAPFALLAPMGGAATDPPALPLVFVHGFYFVRHAGSEVRIEIDGRLHQPDGIPLVLDGARARFLRYAADPFIVTWNPSPGAEARVLDAAAGATDAVSTEGGWTPGEAPRMVRLLYHVASSAFRSWPASYLWRATLRLPPAGAQIDGALEFESSWERTPTGR